MPNPKKTVEHHRAMGNFRPGRHASPTLPVEVPAMPGDLAPAAQAVWKVVGEHLRFAGTIAKVDGQAMRLLAESWVLYCEASDAIAKHGVLIEEKSDKGFKRLKANPAIAIRAGAWKQIQLMLSKFGLTPADRTGLVPGTAPTSESEEERVERILKIG